MNRLIIADDLTGANNVGVLFTKQGFSTLVVSHETLGHAGGHDVLCVDTDSRYVAPQEARERVFEAARWALAQGVRLVCNRVDNLLRGNIGAETEGVLHALGAGALAVVSPAFPALQRQVIDGRLMVEGIAVNEHPIAANDPISPVRHARIGDIIAAQSGMPVAALSLADVSFGADALAARFEQAARSGARVLVVDATGEEHLRIIARAMASLERPCVPVDPGPLSVAYLSACRRRAQSTRGRQVIVSVGSVTPVSRRQLDHLADTLQIEPVRLSAAALLDAGRERDRAIGAAAEACLQRLEVSEVMVLTTHASGHEPMDLKPVATRRGVSNHSLAKMISDGLAETTCRTIESGRGRIGGCFVSGGDVTASLFKASNAEAIRILGDVVPLTAHVEFSGGLMHGLRLVTKGGSIGAESTMTECVRFLLRDLDAGVKGEDGD